MLYPIGRLNGITAEVGTLLGPDAKGEILVVSAVDETGVLVSLATIPDIESAALQPEPRSIAEVRRWTVRS